MNLSAQSSGLLNLINKVLDNAKLAAYASITLIALTAALLWVWPKAPEVQLSYTLPMADNVGNRYVVRTHLDSVTVEAASGDRIHLTKDLALRRVYVEPSATVEILNVSNKAWISKPAPFTVVP